MADSLARMTASGATRQALQPPVVLAVAAVVAIVLLSWSGFRAKRAVDTRRTELRRAEATLQAFADLRRRYSPAVAAESIAWRRTWLQLQELGVVGDERLLVTQRVARAAEESGLRRVKVHIEPSDTVSGDPRLSTEGVRSRSASFSLRVEASGGLQSVVAFLRELPPSVAPVRLSLVRQDGRGGPHTISLAVYELTFTNGVPDGWSSMERGNAAAGGGNRPGG